MAKKKIEDQKLCPECGSDNIIYKRKDDEIVCKDCGMIFSGLAPDDEKQFEDASDVM